MRAFEGLHTVIEGVARSEFVAARCEENQQSDSRYQYCALHDVTLGLASEFCLLNSGLLISRFQLGRHQTNLVHLRTLGDIDGARHNLILQVRIALDEDHSL